MLRRVVQHRTCFTKVDGRDITPGYTGGAGEGWPTFPSNTATWGDDEAAKYVFQYNAVMSREFESPGRPYNITRRSPLLRRINEDVNHLEQTGILLGPQTYCTYVEIMSRAGVMGNLTTRIPNKLRSAGYTPSIRLYNSMLQGFAKSGKLLKFREVRNEMIKDGVTPNVYTYNSTMTLFIQRKEFNIIPVLYSEMLRSGVHPNSSTFDKVLSASPSYDIAHQILSRDMSLLDISPRSTHFVSLFSSCRRELSASMLSSGKQVFELIQKYNFRITKDHYDAYSQLFKEMGDIKGLEQLMHRRLLDGISLTPVSFVTYISTCAGVLVNERDHCKRNDLICSAERCFEFAIQSGHQGFSPLYNEILRLYAEGRCLTKATTVIDSLRGSLGHIRESATVSLMMIRLYLRCDKPELAKQMRESLIKRWTNLGYHSAVIETRLRHLPSRISGDTVLLGNGNQNAGQQLLNQLTSAIEQHI